MTALLSVAMLASSYAQTMPSETATLNFWVLEKDFTFDSSLSEWYRETNSVKRATTNRASEHYEIYMADNVHVSNGNLVIETKKLSTPIACQQHDYTCYFCDSKTERARMRSTGKEHPHETDYFYVCENSCRQHFYSSGSIVSRATYGYGYYEFHAKVPASDGYFPAIWFWDEGTNWYNEIDVFEGDGSYTNSLTCNYPWGWHPGDNSHGEFQNFEVDYSSGYHWYAIYWDKYKIRWYCDNRLIREVKNQFHRHKMKLIVNVALRSDAEEGSKISSNTIFPNHMRIDTIRVYKQAPDRRQSPVNRPRILTQFSNNGNLNFVHKQITLDGGAIVPQNARLSFYATDSITLDKGFSVPKGAEMTMDICNGFPDRTP